MVGRVLRYIVNPTVHRKSTNCRLCDSIPIRGDYNVSEFDKHIRGTVSL